MKKIYFAHAMTDYGNDREAAALHTLRHNSVHNFEPMDIINPNDPGHQLVCKAFKLSGKNAMDYFCALVRSCDALAFMATKYDEIGPGVAKEIIEALVFEKPVFEVTPHRLLHRPTPNLIFSHRPILTVAAMRERVVEMEAKTS